MNHTEALKLLYEYTPSESLRKHALAVESAMRAYARKYGENEEKWGIVGLLHDFDYEKYGASPEGHPAKGAEVLKAKGYPDDVIYAIKAHANYLGLERKSLMDKALFAVDELTGLITAVALVRPSKSVLDVKVSSVKKKLKDRRFAQAVSREDIYEGAEALGVELDEHIDLVIKAMQEVADDLGLN